MNEPIPYIVHESILARMERTIKRLWILCIIIFVAFVVSNGMWVYYEGQFTTVETVETVEQDVDTGDGTAMVTGIGDINGARTSESNKEDKDTSEKSQ